jgi:hypothetical protein
MKKFTLGQTIIGFNGTTYEVRVLQTRRFLEEGKEVEVNLVSLYNSKSSKYLDRKILADKDGHEYVNYGTGYGRDRILNKVIRA